MRDLMSYLVEVARTHVVMWGAIIAIVAGVAFSARSLMWLSTRLFGSPAVLLIAFGVMAALYVGWILLDNGRHVSLRRKRV